MNADFYKRLFESIRREDQDQMVISLASGFEIAVQQIARVEEEMVMFRGRIGGQVDTNRLFLVPYEQITVAYVNRAVRAEEAELFSPSVSLERKAEIAKQVQQSIERDRAASKQAEAERQRAGSQGNDRVDVKRQLEALREMAGFGPESASAKDQSPAPVAIAVNDLAPPPGLKFDQSKQPFGGASAMPGASGQPGGMKPLPGAVRGAAPASGKK